MALFKTIDELVNYISIDVNMPFEIIKPFIESAESDFLRPLLGAEFYAEVLAAYTAAQNIDDLPAELKVLMPYIQKSLAQYAGFHSVEEIGVSVGAAGIQQSFSANSQPAPAWKVKDLKMKYINAGDKAADLLLEFLEMASIVPDGETEDDRLYKTWYNSDANTKLSGCIVYKTSIANKYIDILDSRRLFLRLKKRIKEIETGFLKRLICKPQYDAIVAYLKDPEEGNDPIDALIPYLEPIIAKRALYATLPLLPVIITADGLFLQSSNDSVIQKAQAGIQEKAALALQLKEGEDVGYDSDEAKLIAFIKENIADYPLISSSPCWTGDPSSSDPKWKIDNNPCNKHVSV